MNSGDTIGKYRLVTRLGRGGMGEVWLAKASGHGGFTKTVVVKTLLPQLASDPLFIELLAREAKISATLSHPNLIEVFDFTAHDGIYLLAMEYVAGQPLNQIMRAAHERGWEVPAWFALRVAWECCCGLAYAHDQGVIHCDLSPSNVMVTFTGMTKLLDFGVAHATALGPTSDRLQGKYSYMAPERVTTRVTDRRTDIYALGVMLYLLFTGRLPFSGGTDAELLQNIVRRRARLPRELCVIDPRIEQVIVRAMQPDPGVRYQTMAEVLAGLAPCLDGHLGTYGQQHVAALVAQLFPASAPSAELTPLPLPPIPQAPARRPRPPRTSPPVAAAPPHDADLEIEIEPDPTTGSQPAPAPARTPLASSEVAPLTRPPTPLIAAFARPSTAPEPTASVKSLFDERPSITSTSNLFARGTRDPVAADPVAEARAGAPRWPSAPDERATPASGEPRRGVFDSTTPARSEPDAWPWPASRTKPE